MNKIKKFFGLCLASVFIIHCSSTTKIASVPEGAKIYIDQEYKGVTPYVHTDRKPSWAETKIELKMDGYKDFNIIVKKFNEDYNFWAGCTGFFILIPLIWLFSYNPSRIYELEKK